MVQNNPFQIIDERLDQIETLVRQIQSSQKASKVEFNPNRRLTRKNLKEEYSISYATIHNLMKSGKLQYEKCGRKTLFRRDQVEACFSSDKQR